MSQFQVGIVNASFHDVKWPDTTSFSLKSPAKWQYCPTCSSNCTSINGLQWQKDFLAASKVLFLRAMDTSPIFHLCNWYAFQELRISFYDKWKLQKHGHNKISSRDLWLIQYTKLFRIVWNSWWILLSRMGDGNIYTNGKKTTIGSAKLKMYNSNRYAQFKDILQPWQLSLFHLILFSPDTSSQG